MKRIPRLIAVLLCMLLMLSLVPNVFAAEAFDYNEHDVGKLRAFFAQTGESGYTNGRTINGSTFDIDDPSTWKKCTWNAEGRLESLAFDNLGWYVVGTLDLSGCTGLVTLMGRDCELTEVNVSGCTSLDTLIVTGNYITELNIANTPALTMLWFDHNEIASIDVSGNPELRSFDCSYNLLTRLDVTSCTNLTTLRCSNNSITALDVTRSPLITELNCKTNLIEELDISGLTGLRTFFCFNNRIKTLDISVMNGGESFIIEAVGHGYIGFRTYAGSAMTYKASSNAAEGGVFRGWYSDGAYAHDEADFVLPLGQGPRRLTAYFYELGDVDHSMDVDSADALMMLRFALRIIDDTQLDQILGDMDGNGAYDSSDALLILRRALGIS